MEPSLISEGNACRDAPSSARASFNGALADQRGKRCKWARFQAAPTASMEPSLISEGNFLRHAGQPTRGVASMEPSLISEGNMPMNPITKERAALQWSPR